MIEKFVLFFYFYLIYINGEVTRKHEEGGGDH